MGADEMDLRAGFPLFETAEMHEAWICTPLRTFIFRLQAFSVAQPFPYSLKLEVTASKRKIQELAFSLPSYFSSSPKSPPERNVPRMILNKEPLFR